MTESQAENGGTCLILSKFVILIPYGLVKFKKEDSPKP